MKKNDIALILIVVILVGSVVYFGLKLFLGDQQVKPVQVESAKAIQSTVVDPPGSVFNENAINPTVPITIQGGDKTPLGQ